MFGESKEKSEYTALPSGDYNAQFNNCDLDETGTHPMINAEFMVTSGEFKGRKLWKRFYFSDGTASKFIPWQMSVFGIKDAISAANATSHSETARAALREMASVFGREYAVEVSQREYNGKTYNDLTLKGDAQPVVKNHAVDIKRSPDPKPPEMAHDEIPF